MIWLRRFNRALLALAVLLIPIAVATPAHGKPASAAKLDGIEGFVKNIVEEQLDEGEIPGAAVTVVSGGETVLSKGYGVADVGKDTPVTEDTGFYTASLAKLFTATAAMQLVDEGKLDLDTDVNEYLDSVEVPEAYGKPITLENLLTYTSGFEYDVYGWSQWSADELPSLSEFAEEFQPERVRPPGETVAYNNFDYVLAGLIVEQAAEKPYQDYVAEKVFKPLGMESTTAVTPTPKELKAQFAKPYSPDGSGGQTPVSGQLSPVAPAGGSTISNGPDMARFMRAMLHNDSTLGKDVSKRMMSQHFAASKKVPGMGYAFEQRPRNGVPIAHKDGDLPGVHTEMALLKEQNVGIHVVYNGDGAGTVAAWDGVELINKIVDEYFPAPDPDPQALDSAEPAQYEGEYADARTPENTWGKVATLTGAVTVEAQDDQTLTTTGLSANPSEATQRWKPIGGSEGLYHEIDGQAKIAFQDGQLVSSQDPAASYERLAWYQSPSAHMTIFSVSGLVLLLAFLAYPVVVLLRRRRQQHAKPARAATFLAWFTAATTTGFLALFAMLVSDFNALNAMMLTGGLPLSLPLNTMTVLALLAIGVAVNAVLSWWRGWWTPTGRFAHSLVAVAGIGFVAISVYYGLIGLPYTLTV